VLKKVGWVICFMVMAVLITACGGDGASALVGQWEMVLSDDAYVPAGEFSFDFFSDGNGAMTDRGRTSAFTWSADNGRLMVTQSGQTEILDYQIRGNVLTTTFSFPGGEGVDTFHRVGFVDRVAVARALPTPEPVATPTPVPVATPVPPPAPPPVAGLDVHDLGGMPLPLQYRHVIYAQGGDTILPIALQTNRNIDLIFGPHPPFFDLPVSISNSFVVDLMDYIQIEIPQAMRDDGFRISMFPLSDPGDYWLITDYITQIRFENPGHFGLLINEEALISFFVRNV